MAGNFQTYLKNSGPGWIQAAVTLGGGTLVNALYLGVIGGYRFLWLQPLAMLCGVIMLGVLNYVTLSQDDPSSNRPFKLVKKNISPILAWGWLVAAVIANIVFCASQFALGTDAIQGNLGLANANPYLITTLLFVVAMTLIWLFSGEGRISEWVNTIIKLLVAVIVVAFMIVVIVLMYNGAIDWSGFLNGWLPNFNLLFEPAEIYSSYIDSSSNAEFWNSYIADNQRNIVIGAFGTAVGINMTFLLPYTLMKKGWKRSERKWSQIDLLLGLLIPFTLGVSCLVLSTASQFHGKSNAIIDDNAYHEVLDARLAFEIQGYHTLNNEVKTELRNGADLSDQQLSTMLAKRSASNLATALEPFLGRYAQLIFGIGILAMALSTMLVHMMINGYAISEAFGIYGNRKWFIAGAMIPALSGLFSPIVWAGGVKSAIVVPASVIATTLLPIAYLTFILLFNSKQVLGHDLVKNRHWINFVLIISAGAATFASIWALYGKLSSSQAYEYYFGMFGMILLPLLFAIGIFQFYRKERTNK